MIGRGGVSHLPVRYNAYVPYLVKCRETNFLPQVIQEPAFSVANTGFEDGDNNRGCGGRIFLGISTQPSHARGAIPRPKKRTQTCAALGNFG